MSGTPERPVAEVLEILAQRLPDEALAACLPEPGAAAVRAALKEAASRLRQQGDPRQSCPPPDGKAQQSGLPFTPPDPKKAPSAGKLKLYTDGASRGNPGEAGAGILLLDERGRELVARGIYLGQCTNNMAEYQALLYGLREALAHAPSELAIYLDSQLIVRQLLGEYRVKDQKLKPFYAEAVALLKRCRLYRVAHVPREENQRADQLANEAIDRKSSREGCGCC